MFPPPTTTAICTPRPWLTSVSCRARSAVDSGEIPNPVSCEEKASPESLRRTLRYVGSPSRMITSVGVLAQLEAGEAADGDLLLDLRADLVDELADRLRVVLHERLVQ